MFAVHFTNLCQLVIPPRSGLKLGLATMAFITLKLEQILSAAKVDMSDDEGRDAIKKRKAEVQKWLEASETFNWREEDQTILIAKAEELKESVKEGPVGADD